MGKKWWLIRAKVQADSLSEAYKVLRREGSVPIEPEAEDEGGFLLESVRATESPWKPAASAPKHGKAFIGYDANIESIEIINWDDDRRKFVNQDGDERLFTRWMQKPEKE